MPSPYSCLISKNTISYTKTFYVLRMFLAAHCQCDRPLFVEPSARTPDEAHPGFWSNPGFTHQTRGLTSNHAQNAVLTPNPTNFKGLDAQGIYSIYLLLVGS